MSYTQLTEKDRYVISHLRTSFSIREIARRLKRHHTTISRELKRNGPKYDCTVYWYDWTHPLAMTRRHRPRHCRRQANQRLVNYVESKLKLQWSPEEIANRLRIDYPDNEQMRISHETIYRWIYLDASADGALYRSLRRRRKRRRKQRRYGAGKRFHSDKIGIEQRPEIVATRQRFGDWEGDTVQGKPGTGCLATMVERKSRYSGGYKTGGQKGCNADSQQHQSLRPDPAGDAPDADTGQRLRVREFQGTGGKDTAENLLCRALCGLATRSERKH
jgi:transposase, IS30 family